MGEPLDLAVVAGGSSSFGNTLMRPPTSEVLFAFATYAGLAFAEGTAGGGGIALARGLWASEPLADAVRENVECAKLEADASAETNWTSGTGLKRAAVSEGNGGNIKISFSRQLAFHFKISCSFMGPA